MKMVLDVMIHVSLFTLIFTKLTNETWNRFPYDAPVRFFWTDFLALAFLAFLVVRIKAYPEAPLLLASRAKNFLAATQQEKSAKKITLLLFLLFFGVLFALHVLRHWSFNTELYDQSFVHQALFWPWDKYPLQSDVMGRGTFLSAHLAFSFFVLAPLTAYIHVDEFIFFLQGLVIAIPLWLAFSFGPLKDLRKYWVVTFLVIACHAAIRNGLVWDFREDCLAFCFLLLSTLALGRGKIALYSVFLILSVLSKEYISFITFFMAFPIMLEPNPRLGKKQRIAAAVGTALFSIAWSVISLKVLTPLFSVNGATGHDMVRYFPGLGTKPSEVVFTLLTYPGILLSTITTRLFMWEAVSYVLFLVMPFLYFLRKGGWWLVPAVPGIMMNLLAERPFLRFLSFHYDWVILPFLIISLMAGIGKTAQGKNIEMKKWALALSVAFVFSGTWPLLRAYETFMPTSAQFKDVLYLKSIPNEGVLGVGWNKAIPHLSHVREIRMFNEKVYSTSAAEKTWDIFWALNESDRTLIEGHGAHESTRMLLDAQSPVEHFIASESLRRGWRLVSKSPSEQYAYLKKMN